MKTIIRSEWPQCYYEEEDRAVRKQLLLDHMAEAADKEADEIRLKLWEVRYAPRGKASAQTDYFVKSFLSLMTEAKLTINFFNMKRELKNMDQLMKDLCIRSSDFFDPSAFSNEALVKELLYKEYQALACFYYHFSLRDRRYGTALMGTLSMKEEQVIEKLAGDIRRACVTTPEIFHLEEEFSAFKEACFEVFCDEYPNQAQFLTP